MQRRVASLRLFNFYSRLNYNKLQFSIPYSLALVLCAGKRRKRERGRGPALSFFLQFAICIAQCAFFSNVSLFYRVCKSRSEQSRAASRPRPQCWHRPHPHTHTQYETENQREGYSKSHNKLITRTDNAKRHRNWKRFVICDREVHSTHLTCTKTRDIGNKSCNWWWLQYNRQVSWRINDIWAIINAKYLLNLQL